MVNTPELLRQCEITKRVGLTRLGKPASIIPSLASIPGEIVPHIPSLDENQQLANLILYFLS